MLAGRPGLNNFLVGNEAKVRRSGNRRLLSAPHCAHGSGGDVLAGVRPRGSGDQLDPAGGHHRLLSRVVDQDWKRSVALLRSTTSGAAGSARSGTIPAAA